MRTILLALILLPIMGMASPLFPPQDHNNVIYSVGETVSFFREYQGIAKDSTGTIASIGDSNLIVEFSDNSSVVIINNAAFIYIVGVTP
jgi:hypothetical protein